MKCLSLLLCLASFVVFADGNVPPNGSTPVTVASSQAANAVSCASGTAQQTLTITPPSSQYVYIVSIDSRAQATTAAAASQVITTTTQLGGLTRFFGMTATAGASFSDPFYPALPLKSQTAGTAVTVVSNAAITNVTFSLCATYFFAP